MSIIDRLSFKPSPIPQRDARAFVTGPAVVEPSHEFWGIPSEEWQPEAYANYIAISNAVYACSMLRARTLAGLPLRLYTNRRGEKVEVDSGPAWDLLHRINPYWTMGRWMMMSELSLCLWGETFSFHEMRGRTPVEMWWARADKVRVVPHKRDYVARFLYEHSHGEQPIPFERHETLWMRYPNPINEFEGLSPLAAARLAADTANAAGKSNYNLFRNGIQMAGYIMPDKGETWSTESAGELEQQMDTRFRGIDKRHRMGVFKRWVDLKTVTMSPKDAEFLGSLQWSLEEVCRAYGVPIDKVGGKRTFENVENAERAYWADTIVPEARFFAEEITEQLLPPFGDTLTAEFDFSDVDVLQEDKVRAWTIWREQIEKGAKTVNEYRADIGDDPVPWGDVWWAPMALVPIEDAEKEEPVTPEPQASETPGEPDTERTRRRSRMVYDSPEHRAYWTRQLERQEPWERRWHLMTRKLMISQQQSILATLNARGRRDLEAITDDPFSLARWIKRFREDARPVLISIMAEAGQLGLDDLLLGIAFNVKDPNVVRLMEQQAQRFAEHVNQTTWERLRSSIAEGIDAGETTEQIAARVESIMADRIRSSAEVIARTEASTVSNSATLEGWRQSGVVTHKTWLAALDERTRETHVFAHGQTVRIDDDFSVGMGRGPAPCHIGIASEDIQCRCVMTAVLDTQGMLN